MVTNNSTKDCLIPPVRNTDRIDDMYQLCINSDDCIKLQMSNYLGEYLTRGVCSNNEVKCYNCMIRMRRPQNIDVTTYAHTVLDSIRNGGDRMELRTLKGNSTYIQRRCILHLLNDGYLTTEIVGEVEIVSVVMDPEWPFRV